MMRSRIKVLGVLCLIGLIVLISGCNSAKIEPATISGHITQLLTGDPLTSGTIEIQGLPRVSNIDATGAYKLEKVPEGSYTLLITSQGVTYQSQVTVSVSQQLNDDIQVINGAIRVLEDFESWDGSTGSNPFSSATDSGQPGNMALTTVAKMGSKAGVVTFPAWNSGTYSVLSAWPAGMTDKLSQLNLTHIGFWVNFETVPTGTVAFKIRLSRGDAELDRWFAPVTVTSTGWQLIMIPVSSFNTKEWAPFDGNPLTPADIRTLNSFSIVAQWPSDQEVKFTVDQIMAIEQD